MGTKVPTHGRPWGEPGGAGESRLWALYTQELHERQQHGFTSMTANILKECAHERCGQEEE